MKTSIPLIPCTNCGTLDWVAKNNMHCTSCEYEFTKAMSSATHKCKYTEKLYKAGPSGLALVLVNSTWTVSRTSNMFLIASIFIKLEKH